MQRLAKAAAGAIAGATSRRRHIASGVYPKNLESKAANTDPDWFVAYSEAYHTQEDRRRIPGEIGARKKVSLTIDWRLYRALKALAVVDPSFELRLSTLLGLGARLLLTAKTGENFLSDSEKALIEQTKDKEK